MKYSSVLVLVLLLLPILGIAQTFPAFFNITSVDVNNMAVTSFDPNDPLGQPSLTTLTINNNNQRIDLKVRVNWNSYTLVEANFQHKASSAPYPSSVTFTNRELISNDGNPDFENKPGSPDISVQDVINANPILEDAVMAGYFPDGDLQIRIWVRAYSTAGWNVADNDMGDAAFTIKIRNAGNINLISPGVAAGQTPIQISDRPVSFQWNAVYTGFNKAKLVIREYPANNPPNQSSIENTGNVFYQTPPDKLTGDQLGERSGFSDFLAFNPGNYYAWQVSTDLYSEFNPVNHYRNPSVPTSLNSNWFVFRFVDESDNTSQSAADLQAQLNMLNNAFLRNLISQGYNPVGTVIFEGRTYSGQDALDLLSGLIGKELDVQLRD